MELLIFGFSIFVAFLLGRLTNFKPADRLDKANNELRIMTESRDMWRNKYLTRVMKDKLNELDCADRHNFED